MYQFPSSNTNQRKDNQRAGVSIESDLRRAGRTAFKVQVADLSRTGCRVDTLSKLTEGDRIWITIPGFTALEGIIRWATPRGAGVQWANEIHPSIFDHLRARYPESFD